MCMHCKACLLSCFGGGIDRPASWADPALLTPDSRSEAWATNGSVFEYLLSLLRATTLCNDRLHVSLLLLLLLLLLY